jgi:hydroxymethylpyrimidine pyrophosphatase-like HAD family hydrolase
MSLPIQLISTDFDGTLHADFENPPVPHDLQRIIGDLQRQGARWVVNTGRDLSSVMEGMARARLSIKPDFLVVVERDIYCHHDAQYEACVEWNQ